jgi:excinuclease UvrABC nuclease subunit
MLVFAKHIKNQLDSLPKGWAYFALHGKQGVLYSGYTANLPLKLSVMLAKSEEGGLYAELWTTATELEYNLHSDGMAALIQYKATIAENLPIYQHRILPWANYAYLAFDALRFPFVTVVEHTNDHWFYIGPFRSRFFLADVIDTLSRILKLPYCETSAFPCEKFDRDACRGWCLSLAPAEESQSEHSIEKLETLLKEAYLHPENGILEMVKKTRDEYFNELEFSKAALLDDEIKLLATYRDWLMFLYTAKELEFDSEEFTVKAGKLTHCQYQHRDYHFPTDRTEFRANEALALNMDAVDESRIIYDYLKKKGEIDARRDH